MGVPDMETAGGCADSKRKVALPSSPLDMDRKCLLLELELHQTELELQNEELQKAWQKAAERNRSLELAVKELESFSYAVSHDLRAPLRHINGNLSIVAQDFGDHLPEEARRLLERSRQATREMSRLIDNLLDLAKVSRIKLSRKPVNLSTIAHQAIGRLAEEDPQKQVQVVVAEGLFVHGDKGLLSQLMWNLLENAWKYTRTTEIARIEVGRIIKGKELIIYVKDNGVGFDQCYKETLFVAFHRLHGSEFEGNGIGLATANRVIERHQGRIWAESEPHQGATFFFTIP